MKANKTEVQKLNYEVNAVIGIRLRDLNSALSLLIMSKKTQTLIRKFNLLAAELKPAIKADYNRQKDKIQKPKRDKRNAILAEIKKQKALLKEVDKL